jgi:hypothetical protein
MPLESNSTDAEGSPSAEYCMFCYKDGAFTDPDQTVDGMVQSSIDFMTANLGYAPDEAARLSNDVIRGLGRWN